MDDRGEDPNRILNMAYSPDFLPGLLPDFWRGLLPGFLTWFTPQIFDVVYSPDLFAVFSLDFDVGLLPKDKSEALTRRKIILIEGNAKSCHVKKLT
jgi:hypothetical protein